MNGKLSGWKDTIAALATPPGMGAIGVIRVSGDKAIETVDSLFPSKFLAQQPSHTLHVGPMVYEGKKLDEVVISLYKAPASYTGEDVVEISCHGSPFIQNHILSVLAQTGVRTAKPGEFTLRAFLNKKMNLSQAEAVADLIASNTEASRRTALQNMRSGFTLTLKEIREELLSFSSLIELELDFAEEDVEFADRGKLMRLLNEAEEKVKALLQSFVLGNVIKKGVSVAIIGKPNAGKSTLLNALLNEDRAIVSDIAGTTRDTIEETLNINGILFRLIDTAGLREETGDVIENMGMQKSKEKMQSADIVLYLFDVNEMRPEELESIRADSVASGTKMIAVGNKVDIAFAKENFDEDVVFISALYKQNTELLKNKLYASVVDNTIAMPDVIVTNVRHVEALQKVLASIQDIRLGFESRTPLDLITSDIRTCLHEIGNITGEVTNEDQLDYIFSKFCIGK